MDYIRKQDALNAIIGVLNDPDYEAHPLSEAYDRVAKLPEVTFDGYRLNELHMFSLLCREKGITPEKMHEYYENIGAVYGIVVDDFNRALERSFEKGLKLRERGEP